MDASPADPVLPERDAPTGSPLGRVPAKPAGRGLGALGALVATFLLVAVAKPWAWGATTPRAAVVPRVAAPPSSAPPATPDITPEGLAATVCLGTGAWRVATIETWRLVIAGKLVTQQVRVWHAVEPTRDLAGPADPGVPIVGVAGMEIDALGWCAPPSADTGPGGSVDVTVWRLDTAARRDGLPPAEKVRVRRVAPAGGESPLAALYREVTDCVSGYACSGGGVSLLAPAWSPGRYVFQYAQRGGATWWFGADIQVLPAPAPSQGGAMP